MISPVFHLVLPQFPLLLYSLLHCAHPLVPSQPPAPCAILRPRADGQCSGLCPARTPLRQTHISTGLVAKPTYHGWLTLSLNIRKLECLLFPYHSPSRPPPLLQAVPTGWRLGPCSYPLPAPCQAVSWILPLLHLGTTLFCLCHHLRLGPCHPSSGASSKSTLGLPACSQNSTPRIPPPAPSSPESALAGACPSSSVSPLLSDAYDAANLKPRDPLPTHHVLSPFGTTALHYSTKATASPFHWPQISRPSVPVLVVSLASIYFTHDPVKLLLKSFSANKKSKPQRAQGLFLRLHS